MNKKDKIVIWICRRIPNIQVEKYLKIKKFFLFYAVPIFILGIINIIFKFDHTNIIRVLYWIAIIIINCDAIYSLFFTNFISKTRKKYVENLTDEVICGFDDKILTKHTKYKIRTHTFNTYTFNTSKKIEYGNNSFSLDCKIIIDFPSDLTKARTETISYYNTTVFKLLSLKDERKLKLQKILND